MKTILWFCLAALWGAAAVADTTIDPAHKFAWGANIGWINWRDPMPDGAAVGEFVCAGWLWSANCGWIHLGDGTPDDGVHYSNASATDFGVNVTPAPPGGVVPRVRLRGFAWAPNLGWLHFEDLGDPAVSLLTGRLSGHVWSANCGWVSLDVNEWFVATTCILAGDDTDGDGIADAFEFQHTAPPDLAVLSATGDLDGDGASDLAEYRAATDPTDPGSRLHITAIEPAGSDVWTLTWTSTPARLYRIAATTDPGSGAWDVLLDSIVPDGASSVRSFGVDPAGARFFRIEALRPLPP